VCSLSWTNPSCIFVLRLSAAHDTMINQVSLGTLKFFCTFCREHKHTNTQVTTQHTTNPYWPSLIISNAAEILLKNIVFEQHPTLTVLGLGSSICTINLRAAGENQGGQVNSALCICTRFSGLSKKGNYQSLQQNMQIACGASSSPPSEFPFHSVSELEIFK
jgi:hypothetical protein